MGKTHIEYDDFGEYVENYDDLSVCEGDGREAADIVFGYLHPGLRDRRPDDMQGRAAYCEEKGGEPQTGRFCDLRAYWLSSSDGENMLWRWHLA